MGNWRPRFKCYRSPDWSWHAQSGVATPASLAHARDRQLSIGENSAPVAGATSYFESVMLRSKIKPRMKPIVFSSVVQTVLAMS